MKRALSVLLLSIAMLTWAFTPGCAIFKGKPPEVVAVNASDAAKITVEAALKAWNDFIPVGKPSLEQQRRVKDAWQAYRTAQLALLDAALAYKQLSTPQTQLQLNLASAAASQSLANVISLIRQYGAKI